MANSQLPFLCADSLDQKEYCQRDEQEVRARDDGDEVDVEQRGRRDRRGRPLQGVAPADAVVVASGRAVPVGVETVVGGAVACGLVLGDRLRARGKRFQVG